MERHSQPETQHIYYTELKEEEDTVADTFCTHCRHQYLDVGRPFHSCGPESISILDIATPVPTAHSFPARNGDLETMCRIYDGMLSSWIFCREPQPLQTGMRGAFGKPQGTVARVQIGQVIMSIRTKLQNKEHVMEALCRAKFKFPGRQKIHISKKWGFTNADEFEDMIAEKRLIPDGCGVKYISNRGLLDNAFSGLPLVQ
ncbi:hypothetical protein U0070_000263 [Myodes glareolus]|uniref:Ribosomal protein L10e/L16 domain-containing protein n=1 Tax=Myodes glareolus TaxID=447135 RepID=A0AAW0I6F2_MYOGA